MRIALLAAAAALLSFSAAHAFNPQPDPPGRHMTMDARGRCHDEHGHFAKCPPPGPICKHGKPCGNSCIAVDKVCHR
jgi:hypothetical protein